MAARSYPDRRTCRRSSRDAGEKTPSPDRFSRSRSRSSSAKGTVWKTESKNIPLPFRKWAKKFLDPVPNDEKLFNMYRRAQTIKNNEMMELVSGNSDVDLADIDPATIRHWAVQEAREDFKADAAKVERKVEKVKKRKRRENERAASNRDKSVKGEKSEKEEKKNKKKQKNEEKEEEQNDTEPSPFFRIAFQKPLLSVKDKEAATQIMPHASGKKDKQELAKIYTHESYESRAQNAPQNQTLLNSPSPLEQALLSVKEELAKAEADESKAQGKLNALEAKKQTLIKNVATMQRQLRTLRDSAKKVHAIKAQIPKAEEAERATKKELARTEVAIREAKEGVKRCQTAVKKLAKNVEDVQNTCDRDEAEAAAEAEAEAEAAHIGHESADGFVEEGESSESAESFVEDGELRDLFKLMDRHGDGTVSKIDFIDSLKAHPEVSTFFQVPPRIRQEDGSRGKMEKVFQKIAKDRKCFNFDQLVAEYAP